MGRYYTYKYLLSLIILNLFPFLLYASNDYQKLQVNVPDTTKHLQFKDTLVDQPAQITNSLVKGNTKLYDSLYTKYRKGKFTGKLIQFIVSEDVKKRNGKEVIAYSESDFLPYEGKIIKKIHLKRLAPFETSVHDTTQREKTWLGKTGNNLNFSTSHSVIFKNLLFKEGDPIDPNLLAENERLLRNLPYISDARIIVQPVNQNDAEIIIITKDVYSFAIALRNLRPSSGGVNVYDDNIFGLGHSINLGLLWNVTKTDKLGYQASYGINNISGSFINTKVKYTQAFDLNEFMFNAQRNFRTNYTKYAGGLQYLGYKNVFVYDTSEMAYNIRYNHYDFWVGRSFLVDSLKQSRVIMSARLNSISYLDRPYVEEEYRYIFHHKNILLFSLAFSSQRFYNENLIYYYGRTEDVPIGKLYELTLGFEDSEFFKRLYMGLSLSGGRHFKKIGYLYGKMAVGGYLRKNYFEQGMLKLNTRYFTDLFSCNSLKIRQFINFEYALGIHRFRDDVLYIDPDAGIRGFINKRLSGNHRVLLNMETVGFIPKVYYGFRIALFGYADFGYLGKNNTPFFNNPLYSGFGIGVRIRNENLLFNTFQIRLGYYPKPPQYTDLESLKISGEQAAFPFNFNTDKPKTIEFK